MFKFFGALLDRTFAVLGAALFVQAPLFMHQYVQQLTGRVAELQLQVNGMRYAASLSHKTLEQYIQKFVHSSDVDFGRQGELMQSAVQRLQNLSDALHAFQTSTVIERPFVFLGHYSSDVAHSTLQNFQFGLPLTVEGAVYALIGMMMGYLIFATLKKGCSLIGKTAARVGRKRAAT